MSEDEVPPEETTAPAGEEEVEAAKEEESTAHFEPVVSLPCVAQRTVTLCSRPYKFSCWNRRFGDH